MKPRRISRAARRAAPDMLELLQFIAHAARQASSGMPNFGDGTVDEIAYRTRQLLDRIEGVTECGS